LIVDEYSNAIRMIKLGALLKQFNNYHLQQADSINRTLLTEMNELCTTILSEHDRLWLVRNKNGGLTQSMESIKSLQTQIDNQLALLDKNGITRWLNRTKDKLIIAAAVLYLGS
jgi:hexosaminidase